MSPQTQRWIVAAALVVVVALLLAWIWTKARKHSKGGHPLSGLPLAFAWIATLILVPATILIIVLVLVPWRAVVG